MYVFCSHFLTDTTLQRCLLFFQSNILTTLQLLQTREFHRLNQTKMPESDLKDIEMLEIPEDFSDTESVSEDFEMVNGVTPSSTDDNLTTGSSSSEEADVSFTEPTYIKLQDWIASEEELEFQFDLEKYKYSVKHQTNTAEVEEENLLYKIFENLSKTVNELDQQIDDEIPIGLISGDAFKAPNQAELRKKEFNGALNRIIDVVITRSNRNPNDERYYTLLSALECLKANFFYNANDDSRPELLTTWINRSDPKPSIEFTQDVMINNPIPYKHPQFWNTYLAQLLVRGLLGQAVNAIENSGYQSDLSQTNAILKEIIDDFKALIQSYNSLSLRNQFSQWKLTCCEFRDSFSNFKAAIEESAHDQGNSNIEYELAILSQIYNLLGILTGLPKTIASFCTDWYELYTALSLYQVRGDNSLFNEYFEISQNELPPQQFGSTNDETPLWDEICLDILKENFMKSLGHLDAIDSTIATYISRILELNGLLINYYPKHTFNNRKISEYLITKYAFQCLNNHALVPIGIGLLLNDTVFYSTKSVDVNRSIISKFLPFYECSTNDDLEWTLTICAKLNLKSTAEALYVKYGDKSLKEGYLFEAMNMFVKASNEGIEKVHHITWDLIFQDAITHNRPIKDDLINNIVNKEVDSKFEVNPTIRQCLSPYAVLVEFFNSFKESSDFIAMNKISKIGHLLHFNFLPKRFYPLLLAQYLPFLNNQKYSFLLPDLIVIIELIDKYNIGEAGKEKSESEQANILYKYSISHIEEEAFTSGHDWRVYLKNAGIEFPSNVEALIKQLRDEVVSRVGRVYIHE